MKTTRNILYSLTVAATGILVPYHSAEASDSSQWECQPSKDFRSWVCLKDGQAPVEPIAPEPVVEAPAPAAPDEGVTITPLAEPETIQPEPAVEAEPQIAKEPAGIPEEAPAETPAETMDQQPIVAQPVAPVEPPPEPAPEPEVPAAVETREEIVAETPTPPASVEPAPEEPAPPAEAEIGKDSVAEIPASEATTPGTVSSELVRIDNSLPSCVAIHRPVVIPAKERDQARRTADTQIEADEATIEKDKITRFSGNVQIKRADQQIKADQVTLNKETNKVDASGNVVYSDSEIELQAGQAQVDLDEDINTFDNTTFTTLEHYARGSASQIRTYKGTRTSLDNVQYTSCPPGNNTWLLSADEIVLDDETGRGTAKNAKLEFFDIPIFYAPTIYFPIDDRRLSGLLTPRIGRSDDRGTEITAPIYWNIAPDRDATFYPRYMSKRGLQLGGEFRYLNDNNHGQVNLEYLDSDNKYDDKNRWAFKFDHDAKIFNGWSLETQIKRVSDGEYFEDLGTSLTLSSQRHLESRLKLSKASANWSFSGLLQDFQTIDRTIAAVNRPYERMPHLRFDAWTDTFGNGFKAGIETQYTDFDRDNSVTGKRTVLYPSITYNHETAGYYIRPKFGVHYTKYSLNNQGALPSSPSRSIPVFSVDSGLFYERQTDLLGNSMTQTLEPRIYYLNVAEKNQTNIPIFDTGIFDYNSSSLFRENRFSGLDRIGDTNQVSVGITSRFLDPDTGAERLSLTFGQIYYFKTRDVALPGDTKDDDDSSPIIAEINFHPYSSLAAGALVHWDPETSKTERMIYRLKYQPDDHRILNLAYRFREDSIKQTDVSFLWPITDNNRWHAVGRWNHSLRHDKTLDILAGLEYESCCWKTRFVARRWLNDIDGDHDTGIFFEIELKGLGSIGDDITSFLDTGILGYDRHIKDEDDDTYYY